MTLVGWLQIALTLALVVACSIPLSAFVARVYAGERPFLNAVLGRVERALYRVSGANPAHEQDGLVYTIAMVDLYEILISQASLPSKTYAACGKSLRKDVAGRFLKNRGSLRRCLGFSRRDTRY